MGYSCGRIASQRMEAIEQACLAVSGQQNVWIMDGNRFFWEIGREQRDGAIVGSIHKYVSDTHCKKTGRFRIESNGKFIAGPAWMRKVPFLLLTMITNTGSSWLYNYRGEVNDRGLMDMMLGWVASFKKGGVNELVSGVLPYPVQSEVKNVDTGEVLVKWKMPMFFVWESAPESVKELVPVI